MSSFERGLDGSSALIIRLPRAKDHERLLPPDVTVWADDGGNGRAIL